VWCFIIAGVKRSPPRSATVSSSVRRINSGRVVGKANPDFQHVSGGWFSATPLRHIRILSGWYRQNLGVYPHPRRARGSAAAAERSHRIKGIAVVRPIRGSEIGSPSTS
jgi:hypothetical protein